MSEMYMIKDTQINFLKRWNGCIFVEFDLTRNGSKIPDTHVTLYRYYDIRIDEPDVNNIKSSMRRSLGSVASILELLRRTCYTMGYGVKDEKNNKTE